MAAESGQGTNQGDLRSRPGLIGLLWLYAGGIVLGGSLPQLPPLLWVLAGSLLVVVLTGLSSLRQWLLPVALACCAGFCWSTWHNQQSLLQRLPLSAYGDDFLVSVRIASLPELRASKAQWGKLRNDGSSASDLRFTARVVAAQDAGEVLPEGSLLDLTWYRVSHALVPELRAGSVWQLPLRLKRPRGSVNPHTFDYEGWQLQRGVYATGYVRLQDGQPLQLDDASGLPAFRHWLRERLLAAEVPRADLVVALLLGDRSALSDSDRDLLRKTGTAHLLAISGLHVGMVAGLFLLLGGLIGRSIGLITGVTHQSWAIAFAMAGALLYTLLAGAPLSAQRALVMTWVLLLGWHWRRRLNPALAFVLALSSVLTLQPLAFWAAGFWLSFLAVGALLLKFSGRSSIQNEAVEGAARTLQRPRIWLQQLLQSQWVVALALLLPSLFYFSGVSLSGLLLNLVAIPWMGLSILPSILLGVFLGESGAGSLCLNIAGWQLQQLMELLAFSNGQFPGWKTLSPPSGLIGLLLFALGVSLLLLPRGLPGRRLGWLFLLPLLTRSVFTPTGEQEGLQVTVMDVGQGLAVTVRTPRKQLLYDAGPESASGWSAGSEILLPYLVGEGVRSLDAAIVSHGDLDHAGGLRGLSAELPIQRLFAPGKLGDKLGWQHPIPNSHCLAGQLQSVGSLQIEWLWPQSDRVSGEENDHSCVALIHWHGVRLLLAGDISTAVEHQIAGGNPGFQPVDLLIAPHHGSRSSSSSRFIRWARPRSVVFSAGYRHHFGHPHSEVMSRYTRSGARLFNTAESGAVTFSWAKSDQLPLVTEARNSGRFWHRYAADNQSRTSN